MYENSYNAVRSNVQEICNILIDYLKSGYNNNKIYSDFLDLLTCNKEEKKSYDEEFFVRYLKNLKGIFSIDCTENIEACCERALKAISSLWEASALPKYEISSSTTKRSGTMRNRSFVHNDHCYYACHAVMKITRNWVGHQGVKDIDIIDVGMIFLLNIRGIFDVDNMPENYIHIYEEYEGKILSMFEVDDGVSDEVTESFRYFCKLNKATMSDVKLSGEIYDKISGIGNSKSKVRRDVSMDELYMLLYHILSKKECYCGKYFDIKEKIRTRTWRNWRKRYSERFGDYVELEC